jgi:hypothetical protein
VDVLQRTGFETVHKYFTRYRLCIQPLGTSNTEDASIGRGRRRGGKTRHGLTYTTRTRARDQRKRRLSRLSAHVLHDGMVSSRKATFLTGRMSTSLSSNGSSILTQYISCKDARNKPVENNFYESELQALPSVTLHVERVIRQRKRGSSKEVLVRWRGFSDKFNRWIAGDDLQKYKRSPADRAEDVYQ